jgi:transketolase
MRGLDRLAPLARPDRAVLAEHSRRVREHIVDMCAGPEGGHLGGSMSLVEILVTLYFAVLRGDQAEPPGPGRDVLILSKGHGAIGLYAVLAERGLLPVAELAGYAQPGGRLMGHPVRAVPGVDMPTGSLGHGLALGNGFALSARHSGADGRCFVVMGDGELQEGSVWEAAMATSSLGLGNLTAVVDRNGLQITGRTEDTIGLEPLSDRWRSFGWSVLDVDGHDPAGLLAAFAAAEAESGRPTVLIARTVKGRGLPFIENRKEGHYARLGERQHRRAMTALRAATGHNADAPPATGAAARRPVRPGPSAASPRSARETYRDTLTGLMAADPRLFCLDSDTGLFAGTDFGTAADRYVNLGIAEHNLIGMAAGLAASGRLPYVNTMATFATTRALEAVKIDVAYNQLPVRLAVTHGGLAAGHLGPTHHALEDIAVMRALPGMTVVVPADADQTELAVRHTRDLPGPLYLRLGKAATRPLADVIPAVPPFELGVAQPLRAGRDLLIVACGPHPVLAALGAAELLAGDGIEAAVLNLHTVRPLDVAGLAAAAAPVAGVITVEEHWRSGGVGAAVAETLAEHAPTRIVRIGMPDTFVTRVGGQEELLRHYGITDTEIVRAGRALLGETAAVSRPPRAGHDWQRNGGQR